MWAPKLTARVVDLQPALPVVEHDVLNTLTLEAHGHILGLLVAGLRATCGTLRIDPADPEATRTPSLR
jgi:hypothetical protein